MPDPEIFTVRTASPSWVHVGENLARIPQMSILTICPYIPFLSKKGLEWNFQKFGRLDYTLFCVQLNLNHIHDHIRSVCDLTDPDPLIRDPFSTYNFPDILIWTCGCCTEKLSKGTEAEALMAYQIAFDMYESATQQFLARVLGEHSNLRENTD